MKELQTKCKKHLTDIRPRSPEIGARVYVPRVYYDEIRGLWRSASLQCARVAKSADAKDLKSFGRQLPCGFKSHPGHQLYHFGFNQLMHAEDGETCKASGRTVRAK